MAAIVPNGYSPISGMSMFWGDSSDVVDEAASEAWTDPADQKVTASKGTTPLGRPVGRGFSD